MVIRKIGLLIVCVMVFAAIGCGGSGTTGQQSSLNFNMAVLAVEGEFIIQGTVFNDLNGNGVLDAGEPGIPGVSVALVGMDSAVTDASGQYAFGVNNTGTYTVFETDPDGYVSTTPNEVIVMISDMDAQVDFGDVPIAGTEVDVKPGSDINPLNLRSKGVLPVAILGTENFDVMQIDPASLLLNGTAPLRWNYSDVCGPDEMTMDSGMDEHDGNMSDGFEDMILKFYTQEIAASLGDVQRGDIVTLTMTCTMMDGTLAYGEEIVWIVQVQK